MKKYLNVFLLGYKYLFCNNYILIKINKSLIPGLYVIKMTIYI